MFCRRIDLGTLGGSNSRAAAVNELGQILGTSNGRAVVWTVPLLRRS